MKDVLVSVDVGMNALGWAAWLYANEREPVAPTGAGVIKVPNAILKSTKLDEQWILRFEWLMDRFRVDVYDEYKPRRLALEWPEFRASSAMGHAAASRGNLTQLAFAAGAHACMAWMARRDGAGCKVILLPVSTWKGMLPKDVVTARIHAAIGKSASLTGEFSSHAIDAVGIGLFAQGHKLDGKPFTPRKKTRLSTLPDIPSGIRMISRKRP